MGSDAIRTFFAVDLDDAARCAAAELVRALRERPDGDRVRWVRAETLHVTLCFLGDTDPGRVAPLLERVAPELAPLAPFALELGAAHPFPSARRPRVVALDVAPAEPLEELAAAVERGVVGAGFEAEERPFRAHLTLGRLRSGRPPATDGLAVPEGVRFEVGAVVLFRSELQPGGALHTPLERVPLGARH